MILAVPDHGPKETVEQAIARPGEGAPGLLWLGQAGFVLRTGGAAVVIDPYLSDSLAAKYRGTRFPHMRLHQAPVPASGLTAADIVLCTHRHTDHMDPDTLRALAGASHCRFVVPAAWRARMVDFGIDPNRVFGLDDGDDFEPLPGLRVRAVLAAHEKLERDEAGHSLFLGYVITADDVTIYHSGDCVPFDGQVPGLAPMGVDVALLPVNGRDAARLAGGIPGNFLPAEAVALASGIGADMLVGHHFGLFDFNTVDEHLLADAIASRPASLAWLRPEVGRRVALVSNIPGAAISEKHDEPVQEASR